MDLLSLLGILVALGVIVLGAYSSVSILLLGPLAAIIVALTGNMDIITGYGTNYMKGVADFVLAYMPLFLAGAMFGKLFDNSGLNDAVSNAIMKKFGEKHVVGALMAITILLTLAGVSVFIVIFTIYPMAVAFFRKAGIPKKIMPAIIMGAASCSSVLPGTPSVLNIVATTKLGVAPYAAPITGFLVFFILLAVTVWYCYNQVAKMKADGETWEETEMDKKHMTFDAEKVGLPNPWLIVIPVGTMLVLLNVFKWKAFAAVFIGVLLLLVMFWNRYGKLIPMLSDAAEDSKIVVTTAAIIAFGNVVNAVPGFAYITKLLDTVSFGNPYIFAFIACNLLAAVTASATAGVTIVLTAFKDKLMAPGIDPENMARLLTTSGMGLDSLPHNGAIVLTLKYCGVTSKEGYKYMFMTTVIYGTLVGIIPILTGLLGIH